MKIKIIFSICIIIALIHSKLFVKSLYNTTNICYKSCNIIGDQCATDSECIGNSKCIKTIPSYNMGHNQSPSKCSQLRNLNEKCNEGQCISGLFCEFEWFYSSEGGSCRNTRFALIDENCLSFRDCSSLFAECVNGKCKSNQNKCFVDFDCASNQYCDPEIGQCQFSPKINQTCKSSLPHSCEFGSFCSQSKNICLPSFSLDQGEKCSPNSQTDCKLGYYCSSNETCIKYDLNKNKCNDENLCDPSYSVCGCDLECHSVVNVNIKSSKSLTDLRDCLIKYNISFVRNINSENSTIYKKCSKEYCQYLTMLSIDNNDSSYFQCTGKTSASIILNLPI
ncbi:hypothetical protein RB653_007556 [Dictyostelium firmibasis]|uniref:Dickkopf N-terminal cysteine-rich domain-containing protein n=1 Tax=Dictyostelium firmibasis TaxID=79012 RepID=A0AAN7TVT5_9MYCE